MRLCLVALAVLPGEIGGVETYGRAMVQALAEESPHDDIVIVTASEGAAVFRGLRVRVIEVPFKAKSRIARVALEQLWLPILVRHIGPDWVLGLANVLPVFAPCRKAVVVHDVMWRRFPSYYPRLRRLYLNAMVSSSCCVAEKIIAVSHATAGDVTAFFGVEPRKIHVVYAGVSLEDVGLSNGSAESVRVLKGMGIAPPFIFSPTSMFPHKRNEVLLRAYARTRKTLKEDYQLVFSGVDYRGGWEKTLALAGELGVAPSVRYIGWAPRTQLSHIYRQAALVTYLSRYEGFGFPVLEAMLAGCPVLAAKTSGAVPEIIGDAGFLTDGDDVEQVAVDIHRILTDHPLRQTLQTRGLERANEFSWRHAAQRIRSLLAEV